jgi:hypothetical protein
LDTLSLDTKKKNKENKMASHGAGKPNLRLVRFALDNFWSIDRLERYIVDYQPGGVPLPILRHILGHNRVSLADYAYSLVKFATILVALGHAKPPSLILLELLVSHTLSPLTNAEVRLYPMRVSSCLGEKRGGGFILR